MHLVLPFCWRHSDSGWVRAAHNGNLRSESATLCPTDAAPTDTGSHYLWCLGGRSPSRPQAAQANTSGARSARAISWDRSRPSILHNTATTSPRPRQESLRATPGVIIDPTQMHQHFVRDSALFCTRPGAPSSATGVVAAPGPARRSGSRAWGICRDVHESRPWLVLGARRSARPRAARRCRHAVRVADGNGRNGVRPRGRTPARSRARRPPPSRATPWC